MSYASAVDLSQISDPSFDHDGNENIFALDIGGSLAKLVYKRVFRVRSGFLKVESPTSYQRVVGTSIRGSTFWGLGTLLSGGKIAVM
ncbi:hypothetical protein MN116_008817 [Schistosoma mekongi]|uniref:Pantothenate kinase n=1 Tax=Schistosoma mekongi TaxID=38744 RepID=A0AAE1Z659_SCHME|nr:hypothetical protein MN116_008817 [Schistosoma mekongi]